MATNTKTPSSTPFTPQVGGLCYAEVPPMPTPCTTTSSGPTPLCSMKGEKRPSVILRIDQAAQTATIAPGTTSQNRHGFRIRQGKYPGLWKDTYFHPQEPRTVPLSALENAYGNVTLDQKDFTALQKWRPAS